MYVHVHVSPSLGVSSVNGVFFWMYSGQMISSCFSVNCFACSKQVLFVLNMCVACRVRNNRRPSAIFCVQTYFSIKTDQTMTRCSPVVRTYM